MMTPIDLSKRRPTSLARRTFLPVLGGMAAIAAIFGLLWLVALFVSRHADEVDTKLGDNVFHISVSGTANRIAEDGLPVSYPDPLRSGRDIWVNHVGPDLSSGWYVFNIVPTGADKKCAVTWDGATKTFHDPCTDTVYGPDGFLPTGGGNLFHYAVAVNGNDLAIDLRSAINPLDVPKPSATSSTSRAAVP